MNAIRAGPEQLGIVGVTEGLNLSAEALVAI